MERNIRASIVDLELQEVTFKKKIRKQNSLAKLSYEYEINDEAVEYTCLFDFKINDLHIKAKYLFTVVLHELEREEMENFIVEEEYEVFYPLLNRMSGLVMKITDEVNPFPFIAAIDIWEFENKNLK